MDSAFRGKLLSLGQQMYEHLDTVPTFMNPLVGAACAARLCDAHGVSHIVKSGYLGHPMLPAKKAGDRVVLPYCWLETVDGAVDITPLPCLTQAVEGPDAFYKSMKIGSATVNLGSSSDSVVSVAPVLYDSLPDDAQDASVVFPRIFQLTLNYIQREQADLPGYMAAKAHPATRQFYNSITK